MAPRKKQAERPKRRKPGTGQIRHKPGRDRPWEAAFPIGIDKYRYDYFATRSEAEEHLDQLVKERDDKDTPRNIAAGSQRTDNFLETWINIKRAHVKPKTFLNYKYHCELSCSHIGAYRLDEVRREHADAMLTYFYDHGFKNVAQMRTVLNMAFQYAEDEGYIKKNPFKRAKAPYVEPRHPVALTLTQRDHFLRCAAIEDDPDLPLCVYWHLCAVLGFRRGEGLGLRWVDIDWEKKTVTIAQQYTPVGNEMWLGTPKTKRGRRTMPVPNDILALLHDLKTVSLKRAAQTSRIPVLVFEAADGGPIPSGVIRHRWEKLKKRAGLPDGITIHGLRHTALTILEQGGAPVSVVQAIAGHSAASMTRHYVDHADLDAMRKVVGA